MTTLHTTMTVPEAIKWAELILTVPEDAYWMDAIQIHNLNLMVKTLLEEVKNHQ